VSGKPAAGDGAVLGLGFGLGGLTGAGLEDGLELGLELGFAFALAFALGFAVAPRVGLGTAGVFGAGVHATSVASTRPAPDRNSAAVRPDG
jgi:hypothetical protein